MRIIVAALVALTLSQSAVAQIELLDTPLGPIWHLSEPSGGDLSGGTDALPHIDLSGTLGFDGAWVATYVRANEAGEFPVQALAFTVGEGEFVSYASWRVPESIGENYFGNCSPNYERTCGNVSSQTTEIRRGIGLDGPLVYSKTHPILSGTGEITRSSGYLFAGDYTIFAADYGTDDGLPANGNWIAVMRITSQPIPEPATSAMVVLCVVGILVSRRRVEG